MKDICYKSVRKVNEGGNIKKEMLLQLVTCLVELNSCGVTQGGLWLSDARALVRGKSEGVLLR